MRTLGFIIGIVMAIPLALGLYEFTQWINTEDGQRWLLLFSNHTDLVTAACVVATIYFVPSIIAILKRRQNCAAIVALNVFLGWTLIGWLGSLIWALTRAKFDAQPSSVETTSADVVDRVSKAAELHREGRLSDAEFADLKARLLS